MRCEAFCENAPWSFLSFPSPIVFIYPPALLSLPTTSWHQLFHSSFSYDHIYFTLPNCNVHSIPRTMVNVATIHNWLSSSSSPTSPPDRKRYKFNNHISRFRHNNRRRNDEKLRTLGILAFDTAKIMSRLVSLYKSLSDNEIDRLRRHVMKSRGVIYLNSDDEGFLLTLACAERLEELDRVASVVARLGLKCSDFGLNRFDQIYRELKLGNIKEDKLSYGATAVEKIVDKMERLTLSTSKLFAELETLSELEISERRVNMWRMNPPGTFAAGSPDNSNSKSNSHSKPHGQANFDLFDRKIGNQRKLVRHFKGVSLWNQSYDKCVGFMARVVCVLYARICTVFGPFVSVLPTSTANSHVKHSLRQWLAVGEPETGKLFDYPAIETSCSGPIVSTANIDNKASLVRFSSRESNVFVSESALCVGFGTGCRTSDYGCSGAAACLVHHNNKVFRAAPATTVGGSGMAMRYAHVITIADNYLKSNSPISDQAREDLYDMLPANMKANVGSKLRNAWKQMVEENTRGSSGGDALAEGWRQPLSDIMEWLSPMAHDTLAWQTERNMERQKFEAKPTLLLLQTLHYSDLEKTEAAIVNVLVGLSCIFWYQNRRSDDIEKY